MNVSIDDWNGGIMQSADESSSPITFVNASAEHILLNDLFIVPTV